MRWTGLACAVSISVFIAISCVKRTPPQPGTNAAGANESESAAKPKRSPDEASSANTRSRGASPEAGSRPGRMYGGAQDVRREPPAPGKGDLALRTAEELESIDGLAYRLREGAPEVAPPERLERPSATPLDDARADQLLSRLPAMEKQEGEHAKFALRRSSLPPPQKGDIVNEPFPPKSKGAAPAVERGKLEILRDEPEGEVPYAPHLSITFSQPMIAVASVAELEAKAVPVKLDPRPPGRWRWLGTKTLLFEPEKRFPMATEYRVEVPQGLEAASGARLAEKRSFSFSTPPATEKTFHPTGGPLSRDPLFIATFDQAIDPEEVLKTIRAADKSASFALRLATQEEVDKDIGVKQTAESAGEGRWLAFRPAEPFPAADSITINVGPGTPSKEGPRKTGKPFTHSITTYSPLAVRDHRCGWSNRCGPSMPFTIWFNNALDAETFDESMVRVTPEVRGLRAVVSGGTLSLNAVTKGRTKYTVQISGALKDTFGQTLGREATLTFDVGSADPTLYVEGGNLAVIDPAGKPSVSIHSINYPRLDLKIWSVALSDYARFEKAAQDYSATGVGQLPGQKILDTVQKINVKADEITETVIDLSPHLKKGTGNLVVLVQPPADLLTADQRRYPPRFLKWVQATHLGLDEVFDEDGMTAWVTDLATGAPLEGVDVELLPDHVTAKTKADGTALLALPDTRKGGVPMLIARRGDDQTFLVSGYWYGDQGDRTTTRQKRSTAVVLYYTADDRHMYRTGEEVHLKGWVRRLDLGKGGDVEALGGKRNSVTWSARDSRGNEIASGAAPLNARMGFNLSFKIPDAANLGAASITLRLKEAISGALDNGSYHQIEIEEFRRPEFEVSVSAQEPTHIVGRSSSAIVHAAYYSGGGLANAETRWSVSAAPGSFSPPNHPDYTFGVFIPWWAPFEPPMLRSRSPRPMTNPERQYQTLTGKTDASGDARLSIDFFGVNPPRPTLVSIEATVMDVNRQAWSSATSMLVHPSSLYVGLKSERPFVLENRPLEIDAIACDADGKTVANRAIEVRSVRLEWRQKKGVWGEEEVDERTCHLASRSDAPGHCTLETKGGGRYRVRATIADERGRKNESELMLWVAGEKTVPSRSIGQEKVELIPDKRSYQDGEVAKVLVRAPFAPAEGLLTLRRSGLVESRRFHMAEATALLEIPIKDAYVPDITAGVDLVGQSERAADSGDKKAGLPPRPAYAAGTVSLPVPPTRRTLAVTAEPKEASVEPGAASSISVRVLDADNKPVAGADVAVIVVDESVLALTHYKVSNPIDLFHPSRGAGTTEFHSRAFVLLANPESLASGGGDGRLGAAGGDFDLRPAGPVAGNGHTRNGGSKRVFRVDELRVEGRIQKPMAASLSRESGAEPGPAIAVRTNFDPLALFAAEVPTDREGRAEVAIKMPDNLTRYRITAVAAAGDKQFGLGESSITARKKLMIRPSAPRFLNYGDAFEFPVVVQNQGTEAMSVEVALRAANVKLTGGRGRKVSVPPNDRVEVRFPAAPEEVGTARFQIAGASGPLSDAAEITLPIWTPATTEAFATYGEIDEGKLRQPVHPPKDGVREFGGLEVTVASTQLQALTDAVLQIASYPFECSEQLSSRIITISALKDVLNAFEAPGMPPPKQVLAAVERDLAKLKSMQNWDGGFPFWRRGGESWPFNTIHVAHALARAKEKHFKVDDDMLSKAKSYLDQIERHYPAYYSEESRRVLSAYALYVREALDDKQPAAARQLIQKAGGIGKLPLEAVAWLYPVLSGDPASKKQVDEIRRLFGNRVSETAGEAHFVTSYSDGGYLLLHSDRRADGLILAGLIRDQPANDLIPKIVRGLLAHRIQGAWGSTQENVWVLLALDRYFHTYEKTTPNFVARVWLGDGIAGEHRFRGRTTEIDRVEVPMPWLVDDSAKRAKGEEDVVLEKEGPGRLYYRIGMRYAPASLKLDPLDEGFTVSRLYEGADDPSDVQRDAQGTWHVKAGARVRVKVTMVATSRRYHVALVDPLPAGLEALNSALAVTGSLPQAASSAKSGYWLWSSSWYEHQNMRDERAEAFASLLWEGVHEYVYFARATTPGAFVVPPPKAEEMYHPETFGRGASDRLVVE